VRGHIVTADANASCYWTPASQAVPAASTSHGAPPGGHAPVPEIPVIKQALKILPRHEY
jgi:hypothetical protein